MLSSNHTLLSKTIVENALKYIDKLKYIQSNNTYVVFDPASGSTANDFMLMFCESLADLPENIKRAVNNKYLTRNFLKMNCWEFCFLVLHDAGLVKKATLDTLCQITEFRKKTFPNTATVNALYCDSLNEYPKASKHNFPACGDVLLFTKIGEVRPYHAAIAIDDDGQYIEHLVNVRKQNLSISRLELFAQHGTEIFIVPSHKLKDNILNFIDLNQDYLTKPVEKIQEEVLLKMLINSQYEKECQHIYLEKLKFIKPEIYNVYEALFNLQPLVNELNAETFPMPLNSLEANTFIKLGLTYKDILFQFGKTELNETLVCLSLIDNIMEVFIKSFQSKNPAAYIPKKILDLLNKFIINFSEIFQPLKINKVNHAMGMLYYLQKTFVLISRTSLTEEINTLSQKITENRSNLINQSLFSNTENEEIASRQHSLKNIIS